MSNHKDYDVSLISVGVINAELHFRSFSYNWWITCNKKTEFVVLIRLHMKIMTFLKGYNFVITVVKGNKEYSECSGYLCDCGKFYTEEPSNSSTNAISTIYQKMFCNKTRFSSPQIMGFEKLAIYEKLLEGVLFRSYFVNLELVHVFVFGIAKSKNNEWRCAGVGFKSSFTFQLEKQRCLFIQKFEEELSNYYTKNTN
ncbi:324_t:CDS:1 [Funneliformis caledonium]|uniref:324_t:CDS:1 n=1 Tax=Funneliformis caledonium TaxID=1117310 RepID=A0A9N9CHV7_9GLOM|nr:324_t:CDS:1 [Funneliformis caledonium]